MLFLVGVYTVFLWICTFKMHLTINLLFMMLASTLFLLSAGVQNGTVDKVGGWFGLVTAAIALYLAGVVLINEIIGEGREIIPLGHFNFACLQNRNKVICESHGEPPEAAPAV
jgi:succinate-acetate transporter protein